MWARRTEHAAPAHTAVYFALVALAICGWGGSCFAQPLRPDTLVRAFPNTSPRTHADSLLMQSDSVKKAVAAPLQIFHPIRELGSIDSGDIITQRDRIYSLTNESYDALRQQPGFYPLDFASAGQNSDLLINGLDMRNTAVMLDGRPMNDPLTGRFSFQHISPDFPEQTEIITGARAAIYGFNSTAAVINYVPEIFNTNRPYVRIRYDQGPDDYIASGIEFSQNPTRALNFSLGIDREGQLGEYENTGLQYWNINAELRWFADSNFNVLATENFTHNHAGLNGGVYGKDVNVNPLLANVNLPSADYEDVRHDITVTAVYKDSTLHTTNASVYYSSLSKQYISQENPVEPPIVLPFTTDSETNSMRWLGADIRHTSHFAGLTLSGGACVQNQIIDADSSMPHETQALLGVYGLAQQSIGDIVDAAVFGRADKIGAFFRPTLGADASIHIGGKFTLQGGLLRTERAPTLQELYWQGSELTGNSSLVNEQHTAIFAGIHFTDSAFHFSLDASSRNITHVIEAQILPDSAFSIVQPNSMQIYSLAAALGISIGKVSFAGSGTVTIMDEQGAQIRNAPVLYGVGGIYYHDLRFFNVPLDLKAGIEGRFTSSFIGLTYLPDAQFFAGAASLQSGINGSMDAMLVLHIGDAYLHISYLNMLNRSFYYTPFYPILESNLNLGFTWVMFN